jgi:hypothetical protein
MWGWIVGIAVALLGGAAGSWFYFVKWRGKEAKDKGKTAIENSEAQDENRANVQEEIAEQIRKNKELQEKIRKQLGEDGE